MAASRRERTDDMRTLWPAATLLLLGVVAFLYMNDRVSGCDMFEEGSKLHLYRNVDTVRARFCYAADCKLIADQMNKVERANWSCS
jgi:hypothetical protein